MITRIMPASYNDIILSVSLGKLPDYVKVWYDWLILYTLEYAATN